MQLRLDDLGDPTTLSENQISIARRSSAIECELEQLEAAMSSGATVDLAKYAAAAGTLGRLLKQLGLQRAPRVTQANPILDHFSRPPSKVTA